MADIHDRGRALAIRMLAPRSKGGKGAALVLTRVTKGTRDPDTGQTVGGTQTFTGSGLRESLALEDVDGTAIKASDVKLLVSPVQADGTDMPQPTTADKITFDGTAYTIVRVDPWNYAGVTVGFEVQARA
ncbi:hypothetical protein RRX38_02835 [Pseudomonas sp. DTU_2021_1001937_2_SI_NGA_ILE_001]|uniref:hypothetical protein n=1 Tax=Pseudomonas sp. DTU_2021_1001937_2_SI_NGA_ILE_001 TaxID=3077589 RepID=UPI0028FC29D4|nr:hypothetical protein [Pseudomonas sp. DTU_2021_1001937_2_SI_NGA_ILE_001]WNW10125.1 hypothetical protein RRX38_02835 [Pseudomonas sp. DTU_2021_1001937_2_SI_NGA_ILE_001]